MSFEIGWVGWGMGGYEWRPSLEYLKNDTEARCQSLRPRGKRYDSDMYRRILHQNLQDPWLVLPPVTGRMLHPNLQDPWLVLPPMTGRMLHTNLHDPWLVLNQWRIVCYIHTLKTAQGTITDIPQAYDTCNGMVREPTPAQKRIHSLDGHCVY